MNPLTTVLGAIVSGVVLTIILPGFNETLIPIILITLGASAAVSRHQRPTMYRFMLMLLAAAVAFTAVSLLAPGNPLRSSTYPDIPTRHNLRFALTETARQSTRFLANFGWYPALWIATCAAWWWAPQFVPPPMPEDGRIETSVTFSEPGTYVLRALADDGVLTGGQNVTVTVVR